MCVPLAKLALSGPNGDLVAADAETWRTVRLLPCEPGPATITYAMASYRELRSIVYYRMSIDDGSLRKIVAFVYKVLFRPHPFLAIGTPSIGPGLVLVHADGTYLSAERIGANCVILQQVSLGLMNPGEKGPTLGDDVFVGAGAKVLGPISIGDGAKIGANAVVIKDVPAGAAAVGVPARILPAKI
jgi:serine O-acetyltransferase